jgi:hypothetical protein
MDVSEEHDIFSACLMLISCLAYFLPLKMEATCPSEISVDTWRYIPEDRNINNDRYEDLKSYMKWYAFLIFIVSATCLADFSFDFFTLITLDYRIIMIYSKI